MRLVVVGCALAATFASTAHAREDPRLREAEALAKKREHPAAIELYRALLDEGHDGADLRYNLGTLCLEDGDLGCAVLHLRAAARLDPLDDDVRHNLAVALEARTDRLAGSPVVDPVHAVGARVPPLAARLALALPLALLALALFALALVASSAGQRGRAVARTLAIAAAAASGVGGAVYASRLVVEGTKEAVVVVAETPALKDADVAGTVAFTAHAGLHGVVVGTAAGAAGELVRVRFENGLEAWLKRADLALLE